MAILFGDPSVAIPSGTGQKTVTGSHTFPGHPIIRSAHVALNAFFLEYDEHDHHTDKVGVNLDLISFSGDTVVFRAIVNYQDQNPDDDYSGNVTALVIAETA